MLNTSETEKRTGGTRGFGGSMRDLALVLVEVVERVADGEDLLCLGVGDFYAKLFFNRHNQLDGVEGVGAEVVGKGGGRDDFGFINTQLIDDNLLQFCFHGIKQPFMTMLQEEHEPTREHPPSRGGCYILIVLRLLLHHRTEHPVDKTARIIAAKVFGELNRLVNDRFCGGALVLSK